MALESTTDTEVSEIEARFNALSPEEKEQEARAAMLELVTKGMPYVLVHADFSDNPTVPIIRVDTNASEEHDDLAKFLLDQGSKSFDK